MLKKPFDVKRSPDSKYSSLMNVARREVHEFSIFISDEKIYKDASKGTAKTSFDITINPKALKKELRWSNVLKCFTLIPKESWKVIAR